LQLVQTTYKTHDIDENRSNEPANFSGNINNKTIKSNSVENCKRKHVKGLINQDTTLDDDEFNRTTQSSTTFENVKKI
jgi:hypothetical protein